MALLTKQGCSKSRNLPEMNNRQAVLAVVLITSCLVLVSARVSASPLQCKLASTYEFSNPNDTVDLIMNTTSSSIKAIKISKYTTTTYDCVKSIIDEYECYGFHEKPSEAPSQLNISSTEVGSLVISSTLNLGFVSSYSDSGFQAGDRTSRRIAIDTYTIKSCK